MHFHEDKTKKGRAALIVSYEIVIALLFICSYLLYLKKGGVMMSYYLCLYDHKFVINSYISSCSAVAEYICEMNIMVFCALFAGNYLGKGTPLMHMPT